MSSTGASFVTWNERGGIYEASDGTRSHGIHKYPSEAATLSSVAFSASLKKCT